MTIRTIGGGGVRLLVALLIGLALSVVPGQPAAEAIPPGGAGPNTPGTSSAVSPQSLTPGGVVRFTVRGFPKGETLYVKIDDGKACGNTSHGACVYHSQKIPSSGVVNGSFRLPGNLKQGGHTLRFLASAYIDPKNPGKGTKGYTNRSPRFTIAGGSTGSKGTTGTKTTTTTTTSSGTKTTTTTTTTGSVAKPGAGTKATQPAKVPAAVPVDALTADKAGSVRAAVSADRAVLTVGADYAGEWAFVYAYSEPTPLGWRQVAADGTVDIAIATLAAGDHRFAVLDADGKLLGWTSAAVGASPAAAPTPSVAPVAPATTPAGLGTGIWILSGAVLLVGAGLAVVLVRRRRAAAEAD